MTDKYLYTRLFAMKHNIPIVFVQCQYDGQKDMISGQPKDTMYSLFIFDANGDIINISKPSTSLPGNLLQQYHFIIFYHQDYSSNSDNLGTPRKFKLLINKFPSENLFNDKENNISLYTQEERKEEKN